MVVTLDNKKDNRQFESQASPLLRKVLALLAELKQTRNGEILYEHILLSLEELDLTHAKVEHAYAEFVNLLLEACASQLHESSPIRTHIRLVQTRLMPPISLVELGTLIRCVEIAADEIANDDEFKAENMAQKLAPVLQRFLNTAPGYEQRASARDARIKFKKRHTEYNTHSSNESSSDQAGRDQAQETSSRRSSKKEHLYLNLELNKHIDPDAEASVVQRRSKSLPQRHHEETQLQRDFVEQMRSTIAQNSTFGERLKTEMESLREAETLQEVEELRSSTLTTLEQLSEEHRRLTEDFSRTEDFLFLFESDHRELSDELHRVRMLSLTDELTSLPNRRAFMRRLEDEVSRVQRYGYPLALVLLDIDHFKSINDEHGHSAGDAMLRVYADKVLSMFRHHDMVARYGGEEFSILLPNTDTRGVLRAFAKIRKCVEETTCTINGTFIKIPTFSAGLAEYRAGETPSHLIERADSALYRAKRLGRNRIEVQLKESCDEMMETSVENEPV